MRVAVSHAHTRQELTHLGTRHFAKEDVPGGREGGCYYQNPVYLIFIPKSKILIVLPKSKAKSKILILLLVKRSLILAKCRGLPRRPAPLPHAPLQPKPKPSESETYRRQRAQSIAARFNDDGPADGFLRSNHLDRMLEQEQSEAAKTIRKSGARWTDDAFPANDTSLYGVPERKRDKLANMLHLKSPGQSFKWKRPEELGGTWSVVDGKAKPEDVVQGQLGDCWFLSSLSVLARRPHLIERILLTRKYGRV